jgi:hypothetical protein
MESRPVPDPTVLTTEQLNREITSLKSVIETRLDGMDKAIELLQTWNERIPRDIKTEVLHLQGLHEEKFRSIATQFLDAQTAIDKSERMTTKQMDAVDLRVVAAKEAADSQIGDIKARLTTIESVALGGSTQRQESSGSIRDLIAGLALIVSITMAAVVSAKSCGPMPQPMAPAVVPMAPPNH